MTEQSGIVRRPDFAGGGLTDEEREKMAAHSALWIKRAFRTEPADPTAIEESIKGLYRAANLTEPRVILVPSPFVMAMAGGIASLWWYLFENKLLHKKRDAKRDATIQAATYAAIREIHVTTRDATWQATRDATDTATDAVTRDAAKKATYNPTQQATRDAASKDPYTKTYAAIRAVVTRDATCAAVQAATCAATYTAIQAVTEATTDTTIQTVTGAATYEDWRVLAACFVGETWTEVSIEATQHLINVYHVGNMTVSYDCYLTAARDILGLRLPAHEAYAHWERSAINGGFRWMHPRFCLVSDFPEVLRVNARNQPHAEFGPSHRWRDGFAAWHLNGVSVEQWMAESHPDDLDARRVLQVRNIDQRREIIRRMGMERVIGQLRPKVLDVERREVGGEYRLLAVNMKHGEPWRFLQMVNQTSGAVHIEAVPRECGTVREALNWRRSQNINHDWFPIQLT